MVVAVHPDCLAVAVVEGPADVVVAADVVDPGAFCGQGEAVAERLAQQAHLPGRQAVPQQGHQQRVVGELTFLCVDVARDFVGVDDRFGFEEQAGRCDAQHCVEGAHQRMGFGQAFARGAQFFPGEGQRVQPQHLGPKIGQKEHFRGHGAEDLRVAVVEIPLERVERRPDPALQVGAIAEAARVLVRKNFAQGAVVGVRLGAVWKQKIVVAVGFVAGLGCPRPAVFVRGVVEDEVEHQADPMGAQFVGQRTQLLHLAQAWVDRPVVADRIAAVVLVGRSGKKWHQMQVSQTQLLKIGDPGAQALQIPGE